MVSQNKPKTVRFGTNLRSDIGGPFGVAVLRSYFMTVTMIGFSAGGALGGFLATLVGWRW